MYEDKTPGALKADLLSHLETDLQTREGSFASDLLGAVAMELHKGYAALEKVRYMVWVDETSGEYLDLAAEDMGITPRKEGELAEVALQITGKPGYTLPAETIFTTEDGLAFSTAKAATIPEEGVVLVPAEAVETGSRYNVEAGTITIAMTNDSRVEAVANPGPAMGGADQESGSSLYDRIKAARQRPSTSGNERHYEEWARAEAGVGMARSRGLWDGNGTVLVLIAGEDGLPVDDAICAACAARIERERPIGPEVTVRSVQAVTINITATVLLRDGHSGADAEEEVRQLLGDYLQGLAFNESLVRYNRVAALLLTAAGAKDYTALTVNGKAAGVELAEEQVPVLGEVEITWS